MNLGAVLIPGIMGSELSKDGQVIWPGSPLELVFPYRHMAELQDPGLVATDVIRAFSISTQYADLINSLVKCGFSETAKPATLRVFPYDWRKDNRIAAAKLADLLDEMAVQLGNDCDLTLIAHSMGGLVARYYLESDNFSKRAGLSCAKRLITLGTPHRGAPMALSAALGNERRLFLNAAQVKQIADDTNFPSLYQLMPPKGEPFVWNRDQSSRFDPIDIYDSGIATSLGLTTANLNAAQEFHQALDVGKRPKHVRYFFFAGTQKETATSVQMHFGSKAVKKHVQEDGGDGTVPIWSGSISGIQTSFCGGEHGEIYKNAELKSVLGVLLGAQVNLLAEGPSPEISVLNKVSEPQSPNAVTIEFPQNTAHVRATLRTEKVDLAKPADVHIVASNDVVYDGPSIDHVTIELITPQYAGAYRLVYVDQATSEPLAKTEYFVQA